MLQMKREKALNLSTMAIFIMNSVPVTPKFSFDICKLKDSLYHEPSSPYQ